jgi:hypothetical protein
LRSKDKTKSSREGFQRGGIFYRKGRWRGCRSYRSHETHGGHDDNQNSFLRGCGRSRGRGRGRWSWRYDILEIKCYNCKEFGHYASNCHCTTIGEDKLKGEFCYERACFVAGLWKFWIMQSKHLVSWYRCVKSHMWNEVLLSLIKKAMATSPLVIYLKHHLKVEVKLFLNLRMMSSDSFMMFIMFLIWKIIA